MPIPRRFSMLIEGDVDQIRSRYVVDHGRDLAHLIAAAMSGFAVPDRSWRPYGIRVTVEEDCDQGDD